MKMMNKKDFDSVKQIIENQAEEIERLINLVNKQKEEIDKLKKTVTFLSKFKQDEVEIYHSFIGWRSKLSVRYLYSGELVELELPNLSPFSYHILKQDKDSAILYYFANPNNPIGYYKLDKEAKAVIDITAEYKELQEVKAKKQNKSVKKKENEK